jgi:hypothetical protein
MDNYEKTSKLHTEHKPFSLEACLLSVGLHSLAPSPQANYTDWATATCHEI